MISRKLLKINNALVLTIDPFILEYYGINKESILKIELTNDGFFVSNREETEGIDNSSSNDKNKSQYIKEFFKDGRLNVGDVVVYCQAADEGKANIQDKKIQAIVEKEPNGNRKYLKYLGENSNELYSFSGLRRKLIADLKLVNVHPNWVFNLNYEWMLLKDKKRFSEL